MPRKNRRDCRTEEKKKAGASAPREAQIRAIQKQRKSGAAAGEADDAPALTGAAASFLADLRAEAAAAAPATAAPAAAAPAVAEDATDDAFVARLAAAVDGAAGDGAVRVLELGCGAGNELRALRKLRPECALTALDTTGGRRAELAQTAARLAALAAEGVATVDHALPAPLPFEGGSFDVVLVDGRFRTACALKSLQHATPATRVLVHDFAPYRPYHAILDWYDLVEAADTLVVLRPRRVALVAAHPPRALAAALAREMANTSEAAAKRIARGLDEEARPLLNRSSGRARGRTREVRLREHSVLARWYWATLAASEYSWA